MAVATAPWGIKMVGLCFALAFAGEGMAKVLTMTLLQQHTKAAFLGRVMAAEQGLSAVVKSAAALLISAYAAGDRVLSAQLASVATGLILLLLWLLWWTLQRRVPLHWA